MNAERTVPDLLGRDLCGGRDLPVAWHDVGLVPDVREPGRPRVGDVHAVRKRRAVDVIGREKMTALIRAGYMVVEIEAWTELFQGAR